MTNPMNDPSNDRSEEGGVSRRGALGLGLGLGLVGVGAFGFVAEPAGADTTGAASKGAAPRGAGGIEAADGRTASVRMQDGALVSAALRGFPDGWVHRTGDVVYVQDQITPGVVEAWPLVVTTEVDTSDVRAAASAPGRSTELSKGQLAVGSALVAQPASLLKDLGPSRTRIWYVPNVDGGTNALIASRAA